MPTRQIFYSFHYEKDVFRVQQIRNIGSLDDNKPVSANEWETVKRGGSNAIQRWIDDNFKYKNCVIVLVGQDTHERPWVRYEIKKAWEDKKGLFGIHIHNLKCPKLFREMPWTYGKISQGVNPFTTFTVEGGNLLSNSVPCYNPDANDAYNSIKLNIENWVEQAISAKDRR